MYQNKGTCNLLSYLAAKKLLLSTCVSVHVGAQGLSPGDNLKNVTSIFSITVSWFSSFEPLDRQKDE